MTNPSEAYSKRPILSNEEIDGMLTKADKIESEYFRLRVKALIALLKKFGKRRAEIGLLKIINLKIENNYLLINFTIRKKHKKGLFQYFKFVKKEIKSGKLPDNYLNLKQYSELNQEWEAWAKTELGFKIKEVLREKKLSLTDKYAKLIIEYLDYMNKNYPGPKDPKEPDKRYLFPSNRYVFGNLVNVDMENPISGRQLLRLIKPLNKTVWLHLFRETKGAEIARKYGNNLTGITEVRDTLDLEEETTAYRYTRRYAVQEITPET